MARKGPRNWKYALAAALLLLAVQLAPTVPARGGEGSGASPRAITKGPYLQNLSTGSITICWSTDTPASSTVHYSKDQSFGLSASDASLVTLHEMRITGLEAHATYNYYVVSGSFQSPVSAFKTAPEGRTAFRFGVHGDTRTNDQNHTNIIRLMHSYRPEFYLNCGDLVEFAAQPSQWDTFFGIISPYSNDTVYYPSIGNHDTPTAYYKLYFSLPGNEEYYSFEYGAVHFIAVDTTQDYSNGSAQNAWLRADLDAASGADWIFVFFHHPPYSSGAHGSTMNVRNVLCPLFAEHNVTAVFSGHDHDYEHADPGDGIQYFVSGGGGAPLNPVGHNSWTVYSEMVYQFITVDVGYDNITLTAIRENNTLMETVRIPLRDRTAPAPVPLRAEDTGVGGQVSLNWSNYDEAAQGDVAEYRLFCSTSNFTDVTGLKANLTFLPGTRSTALNGLTNGTRYYFAVVAADEVPNIDPRVTTASATPSDKTPPAAPAGLRVTGVSYSYIDLAWNTSREPDLDGCRVLVNDSGAGPAGPFHNLTPVMRGTSYRADGLAMNTTYSFVIDALDKAAPAPNNSTFSNVATCTTRLFTPNRPPAVLSPPPAPVMDEDSGRPVFIAYSSIFSDPDGDELGYTVRAAQGVRAAANANSSGIEILPLPDWNGRGYVLLTAGDSEYETVANITVVVNPVNDLPVLSGILDEWVFPEDLPTGYDFRAEDRADRDANLTSTTDIPVLIPGVVEGRNYWLNRSPGADGDVHFALSIIPDNGMVGTYMCQVSATDSAGGKVTAKVTVRVLDANDPPSVRILSPAEGQVFEHNQTIDLAAEAIDDDIAHGDVLRFEWRADGSRVLGTKKNLSGIALAPGNHTISLLVRDAVNAGARATVNITAKEKTVTPPIPPPTRPEPAKNDGPVLLWIAALVVVVLVGVMVTAALLSRRRKGPG